MLDLDRYRLPGHRLDAIFQGGVKPVIFKDAKLAERPIVVRVEGPSGAGKTTVITDQIVPKLFEGGGAVSLDSVAMRSFHPYYETLLKKDDKTAAFFTDKDAVALMQKAINYGLRQGYSLVIESATTLPPAEIAEAARTYRLSGFESDFRFFAVDPIDCWIYARLRYERGRSENGKWRWVEPSWNNDVFNALVPRLELIEADRLADRVVVYRQGGEVVFQMELQAGRWLITEDILGAGTAANSLVRERTRPRTLEELKARLEALDELLRLLKSPDRKATRGEVREVEALASQTRRDLGAEKAGKRRCTQDIRTIATTAHGKFQAAAGKFPHKVGEALPEPVKRYLKL
jgi:predicted ABC-type ATPase